MPNPLQEARVTAAHAVWQSGAILTDRIDGFPLRLHEYLPNAPRPPLFAYLRPEDRFTGGLNEAATDAIGNALALLAKERGLFAQPTFVTTLDPGGKPMFDAAVSQLDRSSYDNIRRFELLTRQALDGRYQKYPTDWRPAPHELDEPVVLIDAVMSHGNSKIDAIKTSQEKGATVTDILVFLDLSDPGITGLDRHHVDVHAVWELEPFLYFGMTHKHISEDTFYAMMEYREELRTYLKSSRS
jgi:hypothetical protein